MPIHLDKILADIAKEKVLHPYYTDATKQDIDDAWARVGKINKLSVHESRSIFKVLQKKYDQEKLKEHSSWKLFSIMDEIHKKEDTKPEIKDEDSSGMPMEEEEEYEMLDVHEDDDAMHNSFPSDDDEPQRSNNSSMNSPENENVKEKSGGKQSQQPTQQSKVPPSTPKTSHPTEEKKVLNAALGTPRPAAAGAGTAPNTPTTAATAAALQKKGITLKKTSAAGSSAAAGTATGTGSAVTPGNLQKVMKAAAARSHNSQEPCKTIQLPESIKRKLSDESSSSPSQVKKMHIGQTTATAVARQVSTIVSPQGRGAPQAQETQHTTTAQLMQVKQDREDQLAAAAAAAQSEQQSTQPQSGSGGINIITIPPNATRIELTNGNTGSGGAGGGACSSTAATVASTSTNGFSPPRIEDLDFKHDIIFDTGSALNGATAATNNGMAKLSSQAGEIINLGNFDNSLPPTFFKNLCNSSRHEALGLYVANIMNRLPVRAAAKLELGILRAIIDVQSDELES